MHKSISRSRTRRLTRVGFAGSLAIGLGFSSLIASTAFADDGLEAPASEVAAPETVESPDAGTPTEDSPEVSPDTSEPASPADGATDPKPEGEVATDGSGSTDAPSDTPSLLPEPQLGPVADEPELLAENQFSLSMSASGPYEANQEVWYDLTYTNDSADPISGFTFNVTSFDGTNSGSLRDSNCAVLAGGDSSITLAPGQSIVCRLLYNTNQEDFESVSSLWLRGVPTAFDKDGNSIAGSPTSWNIRKSPFDNPYLYADNAIDEYYRYYSGEQLSFDFKLTNMGNLRLKEITPRISYNDGAGVWGTHTCDKYELDPGESTMCRTPYTVGQADMEAPYGVGLSMEWDATYRTSGQITTGYAKEWFQGPLPIERKLDARATAWPQGATSAVPYKLGDVIRYDWTVKNVGTVDLVNTTMPTFMNSGGPVVPSCAEGFFRPGESVTCSASYTITQADMDHGTINAGSVSATDRMSTPTTMPFQPVTDCDCSIAAKAPALGMSAERITPGPAKVGEEVKWKLTVSNTTDHEIREVMVGRGDFEGAGDMGRIECPAVTLAPKASFDCTYTYMPVAGDAGKTVRADFIAHGMTSESPAIPDAPVMSETVSTVFDVEKATTGTDGNSDSGTGGNSNAGTDGNSKGSNGNSNSGGSGAKGDSSARGGSSSNGGSGSGADGVGSDGSNSGNLEKTGGSDMSWAIIAALLLAGSGAVLLSQRGKRSEVKIDS